MYLEKKYQVFVSSTYKDLKVERAEVVKALLELQCIPRAMEYFTASPSSPISLIQGIIEKCDYYIVIVGKNYGREVNSGISFTRREYEYALKFDVPVLAFVQREVAEGAVENISEEEERKLKEFIIELKSHTFREWSNPDELAANVTRGLVQIMQDNPRIGLIPANSMTPEHLELMAKMGEVNRQLELYKDKAQDHVERYPDFSFAWPTIASKLEEEFSIARREGEKVKIRVMGLCLHKSFPELRV